MKVGDYIIITYANSRNTMKLGNKYKINKIENKIFYAGEMDGVFYINNDLNELYKYKLLDREKKLERILKLIGN